MDSDCTYELALRREALATIAHILGDAIGTAEDLRDSPITLAQVTVQHLAWMRGRAKQAEGERDKLRDLLRRVRGYYSAANAEWPAALLAEVEAAVEGGKLDATTCGWSTRSTDRDASMGKILTDYEIIAWATGEACDVTSTDIAVSHQLLRGLLRSVVDSHSYNADTVRDDLPADLRAEVVKVVGGG